LLAHKSARVRRRVLELLHVALAGGAPSAEPDGDAPTGKRAAQRALLPGIAELWKPLIGRLAVRSRLRARACTMRALARCARLHDARACTMRALACARLRARACVRALACARLRARVCVRALACV
jgi:hypothetical protein